MQYSTMASEGWVEQEEQPWAGVILARMDTGGTIVQQMAESHAP